MSDKTLREVPSEELSDVVELVDDTGRTLRLHQIGAMDYKDEFYVFFQPAEDIPGTEEDDVIIFRSSGDEGDEVLLPIEDEALLEEVFEEFCRMMEDDEEAEVAASLEDYEFSCDGNCSACDEDCEDREEDPEEN